MRQSLQRRVRLLDEQRRSLFEELDELTDEQLHAHPISGKWSIAEIVEHIGLAERDIFAGLPDPATLIPLRRSLRNRISLLAVFVVLRFGIPVEAPSETMLPRGNASLTELQESWEEVRDWLESYIAGASDEELRASVFRHPIAGPLAPADVLRLGYVHVERHRGQIRRLLKQM